MSEEARREGADSGDGRSPLDGVLASLRSAWESLRGRLSGARERGDISTERAREMLGVAADRARTLTSDARERFDFVTKGEFDALATRVARLEARLAERAGGDRGTGGS